MIWCSWAKAGGRKLRAGLAAEHWISGIDALNQNSSGAKKEPGPKGQM